MTLFLRVRFACSSSTLGALWLRIPRSAASIAAFCKQNAYCLSFLYSLLAIF
jgi:hypothetical protein